MKTKTVSRPKAKSVKSTKPMFYASLLTRALNGEFGDAIKRYYKSAAVYHKNEKTVFPREATANTKLLSQTDAVAFLREHEKSSIPSKNLTGQRLYDEMRVQGG